MKTDNPKNHEDFMRKGDFCDRSSRARTPARGLRLKLRKHLRTLGVQGKFRTDELRSGTLVVLFQGAPVALPIKEFEGRRVIAQKRESTEKQKRQYEARIQAGH